MTRWSLKVKVGIYAALLTIVALIAGAAVMMVTLYFNQISEVDKRLELGAHELVWDLRNFRDAPKNPDEALNVNYIPITLRENFLLILGPSGNVLYQSDNLKERMTSGVPGVTRTEVLDGHSCRVGTWKVEPYLISVGTKLHVLEQFQKDLGFGFVTALPAVGLVVFFGGLWLGRRAVAPVARLSAAAERISASNPTERLPVPATSDEIAKLTEVLNRSFDRLQTSYDIATRFSADASHQLKTPLAILRAGLDHLSSETELNEAQASEVSLLRHQTRRLTSLIEDLLLLAQVDAGRMFLEKEEFDLKILIQGVIDDLLVLVDGRNISVEQTLGQSLPAIADRRLVAIVLQNLIENAAKYTPDDGEICIAGEHSGNWLIIRISNTGQGISAEDGEQIFERFRRGSGIGGEIRGHGLGLNIARELLKAHGGEMRLNPSVPGWVQFEFRLPASRQSDQSSGYWEL